MTMVLISIVASKQAHFNVTGDLRTGSQLAFYHNVAWLMTQSVNEKKNPFYRSRSRLARGILV